MKKYFVIAIALLCTASQTWALTNPSTSPKNEESSPTADVRNGNIHVAVSELKSEDVQVYPNPSANKLVLKTGAISKARVNIINTSGKAVAQLDTQSHETSLNLSGFPNGKYLLEVWTKDGNVVSKSFVIAR
jgi:type IX secretion system substrate protein